MQHIVEIKWLGVTTSIPNDPLNRIAMVFKTSEVFIGSSPGGIELIRIPGTIRPGPVRESELIAAAKRVLAGVAS